MPVVGSGPAPHWRLEFLEDFRHALSPERWTKYSGQPQGNPDGWWNPSHVVVRGGLLNLETFKDARVGGHWVSGGLSSGRGRAQVFGKYEARLRMDFGHGIAGGLLLWPIGHSGPPEVDIWQSHGAETTRSIMYAGTHTSGDDQQVQKSVIPGFSRWHTFGVEWTPGALVFTLDGKPWSRIGGRSVPATPLSLEIQAQTGVCSSISVPCPDDTTPARVNLQVAWVKIYAYRPTPQSAP